MKLALLFMASILVIAPCNVLGNDFLLNLGPEELVEADGIDIQVPGYSVPSFVDWNNDNLKDLVIGQGSSIGNAKVRVYLNIGTESDPQFSDYFYVQSNGSTLTCPADDCQGCFPRLVYWDEDNCKDLLIGQTDGTVKIFLNVGTDEDPTFDGGAYLQSNSTGTKLDVGARAAPNPVDWDNNGRLDLIAGAYDGGIHMYPNCGCGGPVPPHFSCPIPGYLVSEDGGDLIVPSHCSSPVTADIDGDGRKDLLCGNTDGQLLFYRNIGTDTEPAFSGYSFVQSDGVPIDLAGSPRSRPFVCDWNGDGCLDVLIGSGDGKIHLYRGIPAPDETDVGRGLLLNLGLEEIIQADGDDIQVPGYSVPSLVDWNNDQLKDLVIGQGSSSSRARIRIYLNVGTEAEPQFADYFYAQSNGDDLTLTASGCLGCFPRVVYWDKDDRKDLLVGLADGTVKIFTNIGTDESPTFDGGANIRVGTTGSRILDVGSRATPTFVDWDSDGMLDLVVGALDGKIHIYYNCSGDDALQPLFSLSDSDGIYAQEDDTSLIVPSKRSSPVVLDLDGDGNKDILTGNTNGQLLFYKNVGTDSQPVFSGYLPVDSNDSPIDLPGSPRSRPFVCYFTGDGHFGPADVYPDVLIGAADGKVHLYRGIPAPSDISIDGYVDFLDFAILAEHWLSIDCDDCQGADITGDGKVDVDDLQQLIESWLEKKTP